MSQQQEAPTPVPETARRYDPMKHLITVQGKQAYLPVAQRLIWFRQDHPDWGIETEAVELHIEEGWSVFKATIRDTAGKVMAQAHRVGNARAFKDHCEKSETGAVGRALAMCGYGTQFAGEDLDEHDALADAPQERRSGGQRAGNGGQAAPPKDEEMVCTVEGCSGALTQGQYQYSVKTYNRALCPSHQREAQASAIQQPQAAPQAAPAQEADDAPPVCAVCGKEIPRARAIIADRQAKKRTCVEHEKA